MTDKPPIQWSPLPDGILARDPAAPVLCQECGALIPEDDGWPFCDEECEKSHFSRLDVFE